MKRLVAEPDHEETLQAAECARDLATSGVERHVAIARLGQGWVAEEALAISIYCALVAEGFQDGVIMAVNHDGDSDSTGAITGNILGTMHGTQAIPLSWLEPLELREVITQIADDLYRFPDWTVGAMGGEVAPNGDVHLTDVETEDDERIREKYPPF